MHDLSTARVSNVLANFEKARICIERPSYSTANPHAAQVAHLKQSMDDNEQAREEATTLRDEEKADFEKTKADLETGTHG